MIEEKLNDKYNSFKPGAPWLDTNGNRIQAHGGSVMFLDGVYYFYGENKEKTDGKNGIWHWGVRCYSSTDLYNWTDLGIIIPPETDDENSPLHPSSYMDRPHIIYNEQTKKFVCWLKIMEKTELNYFRHNRLLPQHVRGGSIRHIPRTVYSSCKSSQK